MVKQRNVSQTKLGPTDPHTHTRAAAENDFTPTATRWRGIYIYYAVLLTLIAVSTLTLFFTVRTELAENQKLNKYLWNLYESRKQAANLLVAMEQFDRTGNWLVLSPVLERPITNALEEVRAYSEARSTDTLTNAYNDLRELARDIETSVTYALALHLRGLELSDAEIPEALHEFQLPRDIAETSAVTKLHMARSILRDQDLQLAIIRYRSLVDTVSDILFQEFQLRTEHRHRLLLVSFAFLFVSLLGGAILPWYVRALERRAVRFNRVIVELGERLSSARSVRDAAEVLAKATDKLIGWDAFGLSGYDREEDKTYDILWFDTFDGVKKGISFQGQKLHPISPLRRRVLNGEALLFSSGLPHDLQRDRIGNVTRPSQSLMFVPIRRDETIVGFLTLQSYRPYQYSEGDLALLQWLAGRFAGAIERAELIEKLEKSEQRYRQLIETTLDGVFVIDSENIYFVNRAYAQIFGYDSPEELVGKLKPIELIAPRDRDMVRQLSSERLEGKHPEQAFRWHGLRKDGTEIIVESLGTPTEYEGRRVILGTVRDVTERERAREELEAVQRLYQRAIEAAGAVPYRLDFRTGQFDFPTKAIEELTGFSGEELSWGLFTERILDTNVLYPVEQHDQVEILKQLEEVVPEDEREKLKRLRALTEGEANLYRAEILFHRKDGKKIWLLNSAVIEQDDRGQAVASLGILQDISVTKRLQLRTDVSAQMMRKMAEVTTVEEAAKIFVEEARQLFAFDSAAVLLYDSVLDQFTAAYAEDMVDGISQPASVPSTPSPNARRVLEGKPYLLLRRQEDEALANHEPFGNTSRRSMSIMSAPLRRGDRIIGMVSLQSYSLNAFDAEDLAGLCALADTCAVVLEHIQLFERLTESEEQLRAVWANAPVGIRLTDGDGIVWLVNPAYCQLFGKTEEELIGKPFAIVYAEHERDHLLQSYKKRFREKSFSDELIRELELWNGEKKIFYLTNRSIRTRHGPMLLSLIADRTEEVRLQHELEDKQKELELLASHDSLTGLKNRRLALQLLEHEIERARRYRLPLCVLMIDIDHFKNVNDTYGHLVGDEVLRQFARILERNSRAVDIVGRYGGEEFVVGMPETGLDGALVFAERLRQSVEKHEFVITPKLTLRITCSIGVTQGEPETLDLDTLLALSDKALYQAKHDGRNRVGVA